MGRTASTADTPARETLGTGSSGSVPPSPSFTPSYLLEFLPIRPPPANPAVCLEYPKRGMSKCLIRKGKRATEGKQFIQVGTLRLSATARPLGRKKDSQQRYWHLDCYSKEGPEFSAPVGGTINHGVTGYHLAEEQWTLLEARI